MEIWSNLSFVIRSIWVMTFCLCLLNTTYYNLLFNMTDWIPWFLFVEYPLSNFQYLKAAGATPLVLQIFQQLAPVFLQRFWKPTMNPKDCKCHCKTYSTNTFRSSLWHLKIGFWTLFGNTFFLKFTQGWNSIWMYVQDSAGISNILLDKLVVF